MTPCPKLDDLPPPPAGRSGWPWTEETLPPLETPPGGGPWPRVTIVTPSYNQGRFLEETLRSVLLQGYPDLEYIVMDGGSTDDSVEIIRGYEPHLTRWASEKDRGQSHAINKGFDRATGEVLAWINSDDIYLPGALFAVARTFLENPLAGLLIGACDVLDEDGSRRPVFPHFAVRDYEHAVRCYDHWPRFPQPAIFITRPALRTVGPLDERLHLAMDTDLWLRVFRAGFHAGSVHQTLALYRLHKNTKTVRLQAAMQAEVFRLCRRHSGWPFDPGSWARWSECRARESAFHVQVALRLLRERKTSPALRHVLCSFVRPFAALRTWLWVELRHWISPRRTPTPEKGTFYFSDKTGQSGSWVHPTPLQLFGLRTPGTCWVPGESKKVECPLFRRVLFFYAGDQRGGAENYVLELARAGRARGWRVHAAGPAGPGTASLLRDLAACGCTTGPFPNPARQGPAWRQRLGYFFELGRMALLLRRIRPGLAFFTLSWPNQYLGAMLAAALARVPIVVAFQAAPEGWRFGRRRLRLYAWLRRRSKAWITVSRSGRDSLAGTFGLRPEEITVIYNGFNPSVLTTRVPAEERRAFRRALGVPEDARLALTVGRPGWSKGSYVLLRALSLLSPRLPDLHVLFAGEPENPDRLLAQAASLGLASKVRLLGHRTDVPRLLKMADLFVFPSLYEGMPFALLEAMAAGLPCVASDLPCILEVLRPGRDGLCCRRGDADSLAAEMLKVLLDAPAARRLAAAARERARPFSAARMIDETLAVVSRSARPRG